MRVKQLHQARLKIALMGTFALKDWKLNLIALNMLAVKVAIVLILLSINVRQALTIQFWQHQFQVIAFRSLRVILHLCQVLLLMKKTNVKKVIIAQQDQ